MKKSKSTEEQMAFAKRVAGLKGIGTIIWYNPKGEHNLSTIDFAPRLIIFLSAT